MKPFFSGYIHLWWTRVHPTYFFCEGGIGLKE